MAEFESARIEENNAPVSVNIAKTRSILRKWCSPATATILELYMTTTRQLPVLVRVCRDVVVESTWPVA